MANAQEDLAKFVYRPKDESKFFLRILLYFGYLFRVIFSQKKSFVCVGIILIFSSQIKMKKITTTPRAPKIILFHPNLHYLKWARLKLLKDFIVPNFPFLI
jgi:hypothetical protein